MPEREKIEVSATIYETVVVICPRCRKTTEIKEIPVTITCPQCKFKFELHWWEII